mmetsp:Transcript_7391/g.13200  ORF Transcript_7391/g.13200 Transcript_7391/m.13200 type:complete len:81 (+) Transcript_7391:130-372(+)
MLWRVGGAALMDGHPSIAVKRCGIGRLLVQEGAVRFELGAVFLPRKLALSLHVRARNDLVPVRLLVSGCCCSWRYSCCRR